MKIPLPLNKPKLSSHTIFVFGLVLLLLAGIILAGSRLQITLVDFSVNWSAGSLLLEGKNPYDPGLIVSREQTTGMSVTNPGMMQYWYPPWALVVSILFAVINFKTSQMLWLLLSIGIICLCSTNLWLAYQGRQKSRWLALLLGLIFTPTLYALVFGQFSPLLLLGIVGFLGYIHRSSPKSDWIAGLFLGLCACKPVLLYLLWPVLLIWCLTTHRYRVLMGLFVGIITATLISMLFRPSLLLDYVQFARMAAVTSWKVPTLGFWLNELLGQQSVILTAFPLVAGLVWLLVHWIRQRSQWDWLQQLPWLSFMSLITTVFAWTHDQVVLIPALIAAAILILQAKSLSLKIILLVIWLSFNLLIFIAHLSHDDSWFVWQAPVLLIAYALINHFFHTSNMLSNSQDRSVF